jgi:glycosyltransferase involved in cell wall biosynthesis
LQEIPASNSIKFTRAEINTVNLYFIAGILKLKRQVFIMKRILHIIPSLASGGAERQLTNIISNTTASEFSHHVCTFKDSEFFASVIRKTGHQVNDLEIFKKHPWYSSTRKIISFINNYKPDLITTWLYDASIVGRLAHLIKPDIPLVCTLHSVDYEPETISASGWSPVKIEGLRWIDKLTYKLTKPYLIACSNTVKNSYSRRLGIAGENVRVIYNSVDPASLNFSEEYSQSLRREFKIPPDGFVYMSVGRLVPSKNFSFLLKAFVKVLAAEPNTYLIIIGGGPLEEELKKLSAALNIAHRVRFLGIRKDVGACLEMADAFVMTSLYEGHPVALIEAMFKKLPTVSANIEVLQELVTDGKNGLLFDLSKPDELPTAMIKLSRRLELRERLSNQAFEEVERRFHIDIIAAEWSDFFHYVINLQKGKIDTRPIEK